ncbi:MAG: hypothetical protein RLZ16_833 [Bacteroidota bacterium]
MLFSNIYKDNGFGHYNENRLSSTLHCVSNHKILIQIYVILWRNNFLEI